MLNVHQLGMGRHSRCGRSLAAVEHCTRVVWNSDTSRLVQDGSGVALLL